MATKKQEIEGKYPVGNLTDLRTRVLALELEYSGKTTESNTIHGPAGLLEKDGYMRLREYASQDDETKYLLTIKGPRKDAALNQRQETELSISKPLFTLLSKILTPKVSYHKIRETYASADTRICLDQVLELGDFVEIEAPSVEAVDYWKSQLGITADPINQSYAALIGWNRPGDHKGTKQNAG